MHICNDIVIFAANKICNKIPLNLILKSSNSRKIRIATHETEIFPYRLSLMLFTFISSHFWLKFHIKIYLLPKHVNLLCAKPAKNFLYRP